jgi:hypothetical protein
MTPEQILELLPGKSLEEIQALSEDASLEISETMRVPPGRGFNAEQRVFISQFLLEIPADRLDEFEAIDQSDKQYKMNYRTSTDDRHFLAPDLLTWCRAGEGYSYAREFLYSLNFVLAEGIVFPEPEPELPQ